eukprot:m.32263 g.32263  ORF g.32263 m.32263 type:complete len:695 (+) comp8393_c0_seq1:149-2233(+)
MGDKDISLSVEESNKLREKLGLKPLKVDEEEDNSKGAAPGKSTIDNDILLAPVVPGEKKRTEELKDKLSITKEKKSLEAKLANVVPIAAQATEEDDSAAAWVKKSRKLNKAKKEAEKKAKELEARDRDLEKKAEYDAKHLAGLTVRHDAEEFDEGTTVLTLADKGVLDEEEGDELVNPNIAENERYREKLEEKKKAKGFLNDYNGYDDDEFENPGEDYKKKLLSKYDDIDVITGEKKKQEKSKFKIESGGVVDLKREKEAAEIREKLKKQALTLDFEVNKTANDFYTQDEMAKFKKKKKRKVRKQKTLKADDLEPIDDDADKGARKKRRRGDDGDIKTEEGEGESASKMDTEEDSKPSADAILSREETLDQTEMLGDIGDIHDEAEAEAEAELQAALARTRRIQIKKQKKADVVKAVQAIKENAAGGGEAEAGGSLEFTSMREFVRGVGGQEAVPKKVAKQEDRAPVAMDVEEEKQGWQEASADAPSATKDEEDKKDESEDEDVDTGIGKEQVVSGGVMAALQFSKLRGFLEDENTKERKLRTHDDAAPTIIPKPGGEKERDSRDRDRDRDRRDRNSRSDRWSSNSGDVFNKPGYQPSIKLKYLDDSGRVMTDKKEVFKYISHKFHGKGSGKGKTEKRLVKLAEEELSKKMQAGDTPLGMSSMMRKKMEETGSAHVVLSGGQQTALKKKKKKKN